MSLQWINRPHLRWEAFRGTVVDGGRERVLRVWMLHLSGGPVAKFNLVWYWPFGLTVSAIVFGKRWGVWW